MYERKYQAYRSSLLDEENLTSIHKKFVTEFKVSWTIIIYDKLTAKRYKRKRHDHTVNRSESSKEMALGISFVHGII